MHSPKCSGDISRVSECAIPWSIYFSKAFRRGTAMELLKQGGRLGDILEAGQRRSPAFLQYMLRADIDELAVFDMIVAQEDKLPKRQ